MMRWIARLIAVAIAIVLAVFAVVNRAPVELSFWPMPEAATLPVSVAILIGGGIGFLLGAIVAWGSALPARSRLREAESRVRTLEPRPAPEVRPGAPALAAPPR
jgi:putative membrane protein